MRLSVLILTGLSGAGKTIALRSLEDCGYFCTDNLPPQLINDFIKISSSGGKRNVAIGVDIREKGFLDNIYGTIAELKKKYNVDVVFLEADKDVIMRRFKETRRPHPLSGQNDADIGKAIDNEVKILAEMRDLAGRVMDTSTFSPHHLRETVRSLYCSRDNDRMSVTLTSFGFKYGIPLFADIILDVRFLPNPHFIDSLRDLTGKDINVKKYVMDSPVSEETLERIRGLIEFLVPLFLKEGKSSLNICIGCTGGKHRSVVIAEELSKTIRGFPVNFDLQHREI